MSGSRKPGRLPRGTLTPEMIVAAALRVADGSGVEKLTFQTLGGELGAHPTSIYRHFHNKDALVLALIDALHAEALSRVTAPSDDWADDLRQIAHETHAAFMRHPRVGAMAAPRTSRLPHEFRSVDLKIGCMRRAGLGDADAARYYRVFADLVLAYSAMDAARVVLAPDVRAGDEQSWKVEYRSQSRDTYPNIAYLSPNFCDVNDPENFRVAVESVIQSIKALSSSTPGKGA